ncbi:S-layer homology domain-containing protein [Brevibacillus humidisoli]|uniref:S-layer homology domain-containing protein n=1 Tax=Brevibacillus humidisoli TaxID=2895522 RepID=UPI001E4F5237|nr:S-layer homology domain-containing protein [Brevibacillus humidisoli]UFJ40130.1 S-layer homology domain-containing protein [Brevibacillus humidisoli]
MAVSAAEDDTQIDSKLQNTIDRLQALELVTGDDKGQLNLENPITRAEFATLVVRARGLASGVPLAKYQTKYSDILVSDWYSGWINVASGEGLVKGYPNNTFGPNNNVTYAEAATMLVRALGYEPSVSQAGWPNNFIAKAAELGISDNVQIDPNKPATRADVFMMLDNSLDIDLMKQVTYGSQIEYKAVPGTSLVEDYLNVIVYDMDWYTEDDLDNEYDADDLPFVTGVPAVELGDLEEDEITLASGFSGGLKGTYKVSNGINPNEFAGQHVQVWVKESSNVIVWMEPSEDEEVLNTTFDAFSFDGDDLDGDNYDDDNVDLDDEDEIRVELGGRKYEFADNAAFVYNYQKIDDMQEFIETVIENSDVDGMQTKAVLNGQGQINYIHIVDDVQGDQESDYKFGSEVVKEIDAEDLSLEFFDGDDLDFEDLEEGTDFIVLRNGERATFGDLKPLDVVNVYYAGGDEDKRIVVATSKTVEGTVEKVTIKSDTDNRLVINGETYRMRGDVTISDDDNETAEVANDDDIRDLYDDEVTLYLDSSGRVRHILVGEGNDNTVKAVVTKDAYYDPGRDELTFEVVDEKGVSGKKVVITDADDISFENDDDDIDSDNLKDYVDVFNVVSSKKPVFVELELDDEGDVESVEVLDSDDLQHMDADTFGDESEEDTLDGDDITDSTVVFDLTGDLKKSGDRDEIDDADTTKWSYVEGDDHEVYYITEDGDVEYVFVISNSITSEGTFGYVKEFSKSTDDTAIIINEDGEEKEYKLDGDYEDARKEFADSDLIYFELNGDDEIDLDSVEVIATLDDDFLDGDGYEINKNYSQVDDVVVGRVVDFDKSEVELEVATGNDFDEKTFQLSNAVIVFDDEKVRDADEDDLVILVDTDDNSDKYDFVLVLDEPADEYSRAEVEEFLKQVAQSGEEPGGDDLIKEEDVEAKGVALAGAYFYTVEAPAGTVDKDAVVEVTLGGQTKTAEVNSDGSFGPLEFATEDKATKATINVTLGDKEDEEEISVSVAE